MSSEEKGVNHEKSTNNQCGCRALSLERIKKWKWAKISNRDTEKKDFSENKNTESLANSNQLVLSHLACFIKNKVNYVWILGIMVIHSLILSLTMTLSFANKQFHPLQCWWLYDGIWHTNWVTEILKSY